MHPRRRTLVWLFALALVAAPLLTGCLDAAAPGDAGSPAPTSESASPNGAAASAPQTAAQAANVELAWVDFVSVTEAVAAGGPARLVAALPGEPALSRPFTVESDTLDWRITITACAAMFAVDIVHVERGESVWDSGGFGLTCGGGWDTVIETPLTAGAYRLDIYTAAGTDVEVVVSGEIPVGTEEEIRAFRESRRAAERAEQDAYSALAWTTLLEYAADLTGTSAPPDMGGAASGGPTDSVEFTVPAGVVAVDFTGTGCGAGVLELVIRDAGGAAVARSDTSTPIPGCVVSGSVRPPVTVETLPEGVYNMEIWLMGTADVTSTLRVATAGSTDPDGAA